MIFGWQSAVFSDIRVAKCDIQRYPVLLAASTMVGRPNIVGQPITIGIPPDPNSAIRFLADISRVADMQPMMSRISLSIAHCHPNIAECHALPTEYR